MTSGMEREHRLSSEPVFDGKIVRLRVDTVRLPGGRTAVREVVEHGAAVVVVPVDAEGNVVLVRQFRYPVGETLLEALAGMVEDSETPEECAQRELREEIGCAAGDLQPLGEFWTGPGFCTELMHAFLAKGLAASSLPADEDEQIQVERLPVSRVPELIRSGGIRDAKTIASLLMAICLYEVA